MNRETLLQILDLARWAPSGDNTQPWRFEIISDIHVAVHGHDTRDHVLYDFEGHPSQMAHGALLETIRLAATRFGLRADWHVRQNQPDDAPIYDVQLSQDNCAEDPLVPFIETRAVQRRAMRMTSLSKEQKNALTAAVGDKFSLQFFESLTERFAVARLLWKSAYIRLTCPEAYPVHRDIIEWNARFSTDRIPEQAVGVDALTAKLMRWVMQDWKRVVFFNNYLGGTFTPRVQLDLVPALACASHVLLRSNQAQAKPTDCLSSGVALQRLWLTATQQGLHLQPEMTPIIFRWYVQSAKQISTSQTINSKAIELTRAIETICSAEGTESLNFLCRIGYSSAPRSRSLRRDLRQLLIE